MGGAVVAGNDDAIDVRVDLKNVGDQAAAPLSVAAELLGHREARYVDEGVAPGATSSLVLTFPLGDAPAGVNALLLSLEYSSKAAGVAQTFNQPAYILIVIGENAAPVVNLSLPDVQMDSIGRFPLSLSSKDGAAHKVSLRISAPRTLRADPAESSVEVPAHGSVAVAMTLFRVDAPWQSQQGLLAVATSSDGGLARTTAATGVVHVLADPARMPRLRRPLLGVALLLLAAAVAAELARRRRT